MQIEYPIKIYTGNFDSLFRYNNLEELRQDFIMDMAIMSVEQIMDIVITKDGEWVSLSQWKDPNHYLGESKEEIFTEFLYILISEVEKSNQKITFLEFATAMTV